MWWRGDNLYDRVIYHPSEQARATDPPEYILWSYRGTIALLILKGWDDPDTGPGFFAHSTDCSDAPMLTIREERAKLPGFHLLGSWYVEDRLNGWREIGTSAGWLIVLFLILPCMRVGWLGWRWRVRKRLLREGCCRSCGYDLRASTLCCPECGKAINSL